MNAAESSQHVVCFHCGLWVVSVHSFPGVNLGVCCARHVVDVADCEAG